MRVVILICKVLKTMSRTIKSEGIFSRRYVLKSMCNIIKTIMDLLAARM